MREAPNRFATTRKPRRQPLTVTSTVVDSCAHLAPRAVSCFASWARALSMYSTFGSVSSAFSVWARGMGFLVSEPIFSATANASPRIFSLKAFSSAITSLRSEADGGGPAVSAAARPSQGSLLGVGSNSGIWGGGRERKEFSSGKSGTAVDVSAVAADGLLATTAARPSESSPRLRRDTRSPSTDMLTSTAERRAERAGVTEEPTTAELRRVIIPLGRAAGEKASTAAAAESTRAAARRVMLAGCFLG
ncbi:hypothetical protein T484DRAFT_1977396 [Baffinella frigidus]|nr:hypothetical protein T484DRAFT_1977396 [Cryptophyta sp. CCMP2293]|mmetsp:Transcript_31178/g.74030  ORF Transcript_31178/g.74030 Transcript_31178/m.74030 type:complete len:248 (-) Transcript_31178:72-815(-)